MSWGTELWDQFDHIAAHTDKGLVFCEKYCHFIKERCIIEQEYAAKLKKLVRNHQPKKKDEDDCQFSYYQGFLDMLKEVHDISGQHEFIAENLTATIVKDVTNMVQELKQERKRHLQDGTKQMSSLQNQLSQLDRTKRQYEKAFKEAEKAQEAYKKADSDYNLSRAEVDRAKNISTSKQQHYDECKKEYALELQKSNSVQKEHYTTLMPATFQKLQDMEERRIVWLQENIRQSAKIERDVIPIINTCIDGIVKAADSINPKNDTQLVIDRLKTGFQPPGDIGFEDLSSNGASLNHSHGGAGGTPRPAKDTSFGTGSSGKPKKQRGGFMKIFAGSKNLRTMHTDDTKEDYSHLPPNQQRKQLNKHIDKLQQAITKETAERDGMLKLRDVYTKTPVLGDASSLDKQLEENAQKLDKLKQEISKYEHYLTDMDSTNTAINSGNHSVPTIHHAFQNYSDESISRSTSDQSVASKPEQNNDHKESPDSGMASSLHKENSFIEQDSFEEEGAEEDLPIAGSAVALYAFTADNEGSLTMYEGESFLVMEPDTGDGWTRVRRSSNNEEGFVPSTYLNITT